MAPATGQGFFGKNVAEVQERRSGNDVDRECRDRDVRGENWIDILVLTFSISIIVVSPPPFSRKDLFDLYPWLSFVRTISLDIS